MPSRLISPLRSFVQRPLSDWSLLLEAIGITVWSKIQLYTTPFALLAKDLGRPQAETLHAISEEHRTLTAKISWAVQTAARYIPLRLVCLPQAMAASAMLSRRGIDSTLYLGVKLDQANALTAHAWLRTGLKWVTGNDARRGQTTVACFAKIESTPVSWIRRFRIWISLGVIALVAVLSLMPTPPLYDITWKDFPDGLRDPIRTMGYHDFWFNFGGFGLAILFFNFSLYGMRRATLRYRLASIVFFTAMVSLFELIQLTQTKRNFDPVDIAACLLATLIITPFWIKPTARKLTLRGFSS